MQIDSNDSNCIKLALLANKKFKLHANYMFTYINLSAPLFPNLNIFENLIIDTPFNGHTSIATITKSFSDNDIQEDLEKYCAFLGDTKRHIDKLSTVEKSYYLLLKLYLQKHHIVVIENINFQQNYDLQQDFIKSILFHKSQKTFFLAPQTSILSTLATIKLEKSEYSLNLHPIQPSLVIPSSQEQQEQHFSTHFKKVA